MTREEAQLEMNKIFVTHKQKEGFKILVGVTATNSILGVVYKQVSIVSAKHSTTDIAETNVYYDKVSNSDEFIKSFNAYLTLKIQN